MPFSPRRFRFRLATAGHVSVWPTRYGEVCLGAVDDAGFEESEEEPAFLTPDEARQVARALLTSADEAADEAKENPPSAAPLFVRRVVECAGKREEREACTCGSGLPTFEGRCPKCFSNSNAS